MAHPNQVPNHNQIPNPIDAPALLADLARDPLNRGGMPPDQRHDLLKRVGVESRMEGQRNRKIVMGPDNEPHWALEYPRVMTLAGQLRGDYEYVDPDVAKRPSNQHISGPAEGPMTHVLIETADGEQFMIEKTTPDALSAKDQRFTLTSTRAAKQAAATGRSASPREIDTNALKDVVLVVGEPMQLGYNKTTGSYPRSQAAIARITGMKLGDKGLVAPNHPHLQQPERYIDAYSRFAENMQTILQGRHGHAAGNLAMKGAVQPGGMTGQPANTAPTQPKPRATPLQAPPAHEQPTASSPPQPKTKGAETITAEKPPTKEVTPAERAFAIEMLERGLPFEGDPDSDPARTLRLDELLTAVEAGDTQTVHDVLHFVREIVDLKQQRPDITQEDIEKTIYQRYFDEVTEQTRRPIQQWSRAEKQKAARAMILSDIMGAQPPALINDLGGARLRHATKGR